MNQQEKIKILTDFRTNLDLWIDKRQEILDEQRQELKDLISDLIIECEQWIE